MNAYLRYAIEAVLLAAIAICLRFFILQDYPTVAFGFVILLIICGAFFFSKYRDRK